MDIDIYDGISLKEIDSFLEVHGIQAMTPTKFSGLVEEKAKTAAIGLLEATQLICEERKMDFELVRSLLTRNLKQRLTSEAKTLHLLKKRG